MMKFISITKKDELIAQILIENEAIKAVVEDGYEIEADGQKLKAERPEEKEEKCD